LLSNCQGHLYRPVEPPRKKKEKPEDLDNLDFRPLLLRSWVLNLILLYYLGCLAGVVTFVYLKRTRAHPIMISNNNKHLAARYVPVILATGTTATWNAVQMTHHRIHPFIDLSRAALPRNAIAKFFESKSLRATYNDQNIADRLMDARTKRDYGKILLMIPQIYMMAFLVSVKSRYIVPVKVENGWMLDISLPIGYILIATYGVLIFTLCVIMALTLSGGTGLRWDTGSIADQLALIQGSNLYQYCTDLDYITGFHYDHALREILKMYTPRLGYWEAVDKSDAEPKTHPDKWYGIAFLDPEAGKHA
jgi:hypothetical protein